MHQYTPWPVHQPTIRDASAVRVLPFLASAATVLGAALPFLSPGGPDSQLFAQGTDVAVTYVLLAGLLLVGAFATRRSSAVVAVAGGAGLFTFGLNTFIAVIGWVTVVSADNAGDFYDSSIGPGAGLVCTSISAGFGLFTFFAAIGAHPSGPMVPRIPSWVAWLGAAGGIVAGVGVSLPPPDAHIGWADWAFAKGFPYAAQYNFGAACFYAGCAFAIVAGFALATRWGLGMVIGGLVPLLWLMLIWVGDITDAASGNFGQVFKTDLHPLFGIGCGLTVVCVAVGLATPSAAPAGIPASTAMWAADPFGRFDHRYWDGGRWTHQVANAGVTGYDPPVAGSTPPSPGNASPAPSAWAAPAAPVAPSPTGGAVAPVDSATGWWVQDTRGAGGTTRLPGDP
jgi:hypothetical protein